MAQQKLTGRASTAGDCAHNPWLSRPKFLVPLLLRLLIILLLLVTICVFVTAREKVINQDDSICMTALTLVFEILLPLQSASLLVHGRTRMLPQSTASHTPSLASMLDLPAEIHPMICGYLGHCDLKAVRSVCRNFNDAAEPLPFRSIFLKRNIASLGNSQLLSTHARLS